ncbi:MAG: phage tail domain-containing protein [Limosilactobacillus pontis]
MQNPQLYLKIGDGPEFNIADKVQGLRYLGDNSTPTINNSYLDVPGVDGSQLQYSTFSRYQIAANFFLRFTDWQDFKLAKHQFYRLFGQRKRFGCEQTWRAQSFVMFTPRYQRSNLAKTLLMML